MKPPKEITKDQAKQLFNRGIYVYVQYKDGTPSTTDNLFIMSNKSVDASLNMYRKSPESKDFDGIINFITSRQNYPLKYYTFGSTTPYNIESDLPDIEESKTLKSFIRNVVLENLNEKKYTNIQMHANEFGSKIKSCIDNVENLKDELEEVSKMLYKPESTVIGGVDVSDKSHMNLISLMAGSNNRGKKYFDSSKYSIVLDTLKSNLESVYKLVSDVSMGKSKKEPAVKKEESTVTKKPTLKKELPLKNESKSIKEADDVFGTLGKSLNPNFTSDRFEYVLWGIAPNKTEEELLVSKVKGEFITDLHDAQKIKDTLEKLYHCKNVRIQKIDKLDNNVNDKFAKSVNI